MKIVNKIEDLDKFSIYANPSFLSSFKDVSEIGYIVEDELVLPFLITKKFFLKTMQLPVEILGDDNIDIQKDFLNRFPLFVKENFKVTNVVTDNTAVFLTYPNKSKHCKFGSYVVDLTKSEEELFSSLHSKHRNVIRKAQKDGVIIEHGKQCREDVISLMNETFSRQGMASSMDDEYLARLSKMGDNVEFWLARDANGIVQGSAILLWSEHNSCYYLHGGSSEHTVPGAMNLLMWEAMLSMKSRGVVTFDFVGARVNTEPGSKLEGIQRFKERFGSSLKTGYAFEIVINKYEYLLAKLLIRVKCILRGVKIPKSIIDQEIERGNI